MHLSTLRKFTFKMNFTEFLRTICTAYNLIDDEVGHPFLLQCSWTNERAGDAQTAPDSYRLTPASCCYLRYTEKAPAYPTSTHISTESQGISL